MKNIWINGCFDVLHRGHFEMFKFAKSHGSHLRVGIDSDSKVRKDKGLDRPYNSQNDRKFALECIMYIDEVVIFNSKEELEYNIRIYKPDIMVVGSDWQSKTVIGREYCKKIIFFDRIMGYSTTDILNNNKE